MTKVVPFLKRLRSLDEFRKAPNSGWAGQWDRHRWPMPGRKPSRSRIGGKEIAFMVGGGVLLGLAGVAIIAAS